METHIQDKVQQLGDLDLAILTSLISGEHCMFSSEAQTNRNLRDELRLTCTEAFGLQVAVIDSTGHTTVDEFNESILVDVFDDFEDAQEHRELSYSPSISTSDRPLQELAPALSGSAGNALDDKRIADVIIATNLDLASSSVQVQALELLRTRRLFTRTSMHVAPKDLLLVVVLSRDGARLSHHLNDMFAMSHAHAEEDGYPHLEDGVLRKATAVTFLPNEIKQLRTLAKSVKWTNEVREYLHNIIIFLRLSRYVRGGVTAAATRNFRTLAMALAPLHGLDYVMPSLVALAARKVYPHRLLLATTTTERSLQWGSDPKAVKEILANVTIEDVIEDVLGAVETPL